MITQIGRFRLRRLQCRGFTFIELIIALTIFSIIGLAIYSTFSSGLNIWRRGEDVSRLQQEGRWALDRIAKELRNAVIYNYGPAYPDAVLFLGEKDKMSFLSLVYNSSASQSEIKKITYYLETPKYGVSHQTQIGTRGKRPDEITTHYEQSQTSLTSLQRREETLVQSLQPQEQESVKSEPLTNLVKTEGLLFSYAFGQKTEAGENIVWKDSLESKTELPKGVKITLILQNPKNASDEAIFTKTVFLPQGKLVQE